LDKKKLIGTIIGVTLFAALIAGATFAWLTFSANITNGNYSAGTMNFVVNYAKGTDIISAPTLTTATAETASNLMVSASRDSSSADGTLYIKLTTSTDNLLTRSGIVNYAVCSGTATAAACDGELTEGSNGVLSAGTVSVAGEKEIYSVGSIPLTTAPAYYWIFFWIDAQGLTNAIVEAAETERTYSGYIHASAVQK